jgi:DNA invertase Pin-like site-specific DNA recombinase
MENSAFAYLRVSSRTQTEGDGFPRQRAAIESYATANGLTIVQWFEEEGISGTIADRPAWHAMMEALLSNGTKTVIVERMDRIARDLMVQETLVGDLRKRGFNFISTAEPDLCSDDPSRKFIRKLLGLVAEYDRDMIVAKLKGARQRTRAKTGRCEGRKPYGTRPGEQENIRRIAALYTTGQNYSEIALTMNAENRSTRTKNSKWYPSTIANIVRHSSKQQ